MARALKDICADKNISMRLKGKNAELFVTVEPYDRDITTKYANGVLAELKAHREAILEHYGREHFVLSISSHNIDGLYETNSCLLHPESRAYSNY